MSIDTSEIINIVLAILLVTSEILPLVDDIEANGILQTVIRVLKKRRTSNLENI